MEILKKQQKLSRKDFYEKHLMITNIFLPIKMSQKEINVLSSFMALDESIIGDEMFNLISRKKVMEELKLSPGGLGNYISSLIDKGYIDKSLIGKLKVKEYLLPNKNIQGYQFLIQIKEDEQTIKK